MSSDKVGAVFFRHSTNPNRNAKRYLESRLGKIGSLGPRRKVIGHGRNVRMLPVISLDISNNW